METLLLFLIFALVTGLTFAGYLFLARRRQHLEKRLNSQVDEFRVPGMLLGELTPALAAQLPASAEHQDELHKELRIAGYYRPTALMDYYALRSVLVVVPLVGAGVAALLTNTLLQAAAVWLVGLVVAGLGYSVPRLVVYYQGRARQHAIGRALPTALDMVSLCLSAGLNVLLSLERVTQEVRLAFPELASELEIVRMHAELRTLEFSLGQFADRIDMPQVRNVAVILSQSENLGTDAVSVLREYADALRVSMRQRAEELANKAPFKLLFPAYLLVFGAAILIFSPVALEFAAFRRSNLLGSTLDQSRESLKQLPSQPAPPAQP